MVTLTCAVYYPCANEISIKWYKSRTGINAGNNRENCEYIDTKHKYQQIVQVIGGTTNNSNFDGFCFASFLLLISHISHNDNGYYWCQIVANSRPLEPSPYAYISISSAMSTGQHHCSVGDLIHDLIPAQCAENITTPLSMTCNSQSITTTTATSQTEQSESVTATVTTENTLYELLSTTIIASSEFKNHDSQTTITTNALGTTVMKDNSSLLYAAIAGAFMAFTVVLLVIVLCLAILFYKYIKLKKQGKPKKLIQQVSLKNF